MTVSVKAIVHILTENNTSFVIDSLLYLCLDPIYKITGKYNMMVIIVASNIEVLEQIVDNIKSINGVISTNTAIVLKEIDNE